VSYTVDIERSAIVSLSRMPRPDQRRIKEKLEALKTDPRPAGAIKLTGTEGWRIRSGDYRIVYLIEDTIRVVTVTRIGHRKDVYRRL
jgi:mRNA interferase RelE/StbE